MHLCSLMSCSRVFQTLTFLYLHVILYCVVNVFVQDLFHVSIFIHSIVCVMHIIIIVFFISLFLASDFLVLHCVNTFINRLFINSSDIVIHSLRISFFCQTSAVHLGELWRHAADFHLRSGDAPTAAASLLELHKLNPKDVNTLAQLITAYARVGKNKKYFQGNFLQKCVKLEIGMVEQHEYPPLHTGMYLEVNIEL